MFEVTKSDWKLFREKLAGWQETYMERLCKEYIDILNSDKSGSDRFWELEKQIKEDKKSPGVVINVRKSEILYDLDSLLYDGVITLEDLTDFSVDLQDAIKLYSSRWMKAAQ